MAFTLPTMALRRHGLALALGIALAASPASAQLFCGSHSPAIPVPEYVGATHMWPSNGFRPARPDQTLPLDRDTTQYTSNTFPCAQSGHELFWGLDVVGDKAFVMYNVGISAWDIGGANAENPRRLSFADGIAGHWLYHDGIGEADGYLKDIAAIQDPSNSNRILIAVAGLSPIGATVWRFDRSSSTLTPIYQNVALEGEDVELIVAGGRVYAFYAASAGPYVLDVTATNSLAAGCLNGDCPSGIYLGKIGSATGSRYLGLLERGGKIYMAESYGGLTSFSPVPEIWEVDPANPSAAQRRFRGAVNETHSPVLFQKGGDFYMAVVERRHIKIYNVGDCLDADGCSALPAAAVDVTLRQQFWRYDFLSYSVSEGTPFLYYGMEGMFQKGSAYERLFDLSNLGTGSPLVEMTETGETFTDPCNGEAGVGYWSWYYEANDSGFRNYCSRKGKFNGRYFYRVNTASFDVHVRTQVVTNPTVTTAATSPAPYYFGDAVRFAATSQNCAGPEVWTWNASNGSATGLGGGGNTASLTWPLCDASRCGSENIEVWALKDICSGSPNLTTNRATVTVVDPRPQIAAINVTPASALPGVYPICSVLGFTADVSGKAPLTYGWTVRSVLGEELATGNQPSLSWNTAGVPLGPEVFLDGFESGDTSNWQTESGSGPSLAPSAKAVALAPAALIQQVTEAGSGTFNVELRVDNPTGSPVRLTRQVTLTALGDLAFLGAAPIVASNLGNGQYRFTTNTENATRWRWEIEDPGNGSTAGCQFFTRCRVFDYGTEDNEITYTWGQPNVNGTFRVRVSAANCLDVAAISAELPQAVTGIPVGAPPAVANFTITATTHCSLSLNVMECRRTLAINFLVSHTGTATHYDIDWEGDGVFEQSIAAGNAIAHTYGTNGRRSPQVRARNGSGSPSSPVGLPWALEIIE